MWFWDNVDGWRLFFSGFFILIFWGGSITLIVWLITRFTRRNDTTQKNTPLDIAKERYAKGEITKEQFEQIKKDLL